ncbi:MAG: SRPBCC family protein [Rhodospirillaceae bacterium]|nr:SRPBCC family protein [Rhodospirillaceae bacterium]
MADAVQPDDNLLVLKQRLRCAPEPAFDAWLDPDTLRRFLTPHGITLTRVEVNAQEGGDFLIEMISDGKPLPHVGRYLTIDRPRRLVFTWNSHATGGDTIVSLLFEPQGATTLLTLTQERLPHAHSRGLHAGGWSSILEQEARMLDRAAEAPADFRLVVTLRDTPERIYPLIATEAGARQWWTALCRMDAQVGGRAEFPFPTNHFSASATITALKPSTCVEWTMLDCSHPPDSGYADPHDWAGTRIRFDLRAAGDGTELTFRHLGLIPLECHGACSSAWHFFIAESLRVLVETGTGQPAETA